MIDGIYATATDHHDWADLLRNVANFVGAKSGTMGVSDVSTGISDPKLMFVGLDEGMVDERWRREHGFRDIWAEQGYAPKEAEVLTGAELLHPDSLRQDSHYRHVLKPLGIEDCLATSLSTSGSRVIFIALYQDLFAGVFVKDQKKRLKALAPHLVRAAKLETMLQESRVQESIHRSALDEIEMAVLLVTQGKAKALNRRAEELLVDGELLSVRNGRLSTPDADGSLHAGIDAAGGSSTHVDLPVATPFALRRRAGDKPSVGWCVPVRQNGGSETPVLSLLESAQSALIFLTDREEVPQLAEEVVSGLFGLTLSEARMATAIASGETPAKYAKRTGVSMGLSRPMLIFSERRLLCRS